MLRKEWFRPKKLRVLLAWTGAPLLFFFSHVSAASFFWGSLIMTGGEVIRLWALGFMEKKGRELAVSGPYAYSRNPLYLGNFFLGLGLIVVCSSEVIGVIFLLGYPLIYGRTVRSEEKILSERFGTSYEDYCRNVPRFFPRWTPYKTRGGTSFDWKRIIRHHEYVTILAIALILCGIHLYDSLFLRRLPWTSQTGSIVLTAVLGMLLAFERLFISNLKQKFADGLPNLFPKRKKQAS
ncbi:MAG: isoprenylcysteine carboxylmethyltransferase family protein [Candidatus Omnitrophica bacterium]|nr:isoprenylcysteine carboxylmethyltransferase family protein [Candidatus Omnitrophota bacterium]